MWSDQFVYLGMSGVPVGRMGEWKSARGRWRAGDDFECTAEAILDAKCFSDPAQGI